MHVSNSRFSSKTFICAAAYGFLFRVEQRRFKICAIFNHLLYARAFLGKFKTLTTSFCVYFGTKQNWQFWNSGPSYTHLKTHARMLIIVFYKLFSRCAAQTKWNVFSTKIKKKYQRMSWFVVVMEMIFILKRFDIFFIYLSKWLAHVQRIFCD